METSGEIESAIPSESHQPVKGRNIEGPAEQNGDEELDPTLQEQGCDDGENASSNASSPAPQEPFKPRYRVEVPNDVMKDGEIIKYTLRVLEAETGEVVSVIKRQYEDFEYLDHCVTTGNKIDGIIVPPVPPRPPIDPQKAEEASKKIYGTSSRGMMGDEFLKSCRQLERYLNQLLGHPLFGNDSSLTDFLTKTDPPPRTKVKKGLLARLSTTFDSRRALHPDCDEFFQRQRDWLQQYSTVIRDVNEKFEGLIAAECRMCGQLTHLCTALSFCLYPNVGANAIHNQFQAKFSDALEAVKEGFEVMAYNDEATIGQCFDYYARSVESLNAMLFRRTSLMVDYETANKNLDKAKPQKKEAAEKMKKETEQAFEECSDTASQEMKHYHRTRVQEMQEAISRYVEAQAMTARDTYAVLAKAYARFKEAPTSGTAAEDS